MDPIFGLLAGASALLAGFSRKELSRNRETAESARFGGLEESAKQAQVAAASGAPVVAWQQANRLSQDFFTARARGEDIPERAWAVARAAYQRRPIPTEGWVAPWDGSGGRDPMEGLDDTYEQALGELGHLLD